MDTLEKLQKWLATEVDSQYKLKRLPAVVCVDGTTLSVQASEFHYCTPRSNEGPYTHVEVWNCGAPEAWAEHGDGSRPYSYLPIELVVEEIDRHGGLNDHPS